MRIFFVFLLLMTVSFASAAAEPAAGSQMGDCLLPKPRVTFNLPPLLVYESDNPVTGKQVTCGFSVRCLNPIAKRTAVP